MSLELLAVRDILKRFRERSVKPLLAMLSSEDARTRARAAGLLADLGAKGAVASIVPLLVHEETRLSALDALARLGDATAWEPVARQLEAPRERERVSALRCLEKMAAFDALQEIIACLHSGEVFTVRFAAEDVLVSFREHSVESLTRFARDGEDLTARRHSIRALGRIADLKSLSLIAALTKDGDWRIRYDAVGALGVYLHGDAVRGALARYRLRYVLSEETHPRVRDRVEALLESKE